MTYPKTLATAVLTAALMVPVGASAGLQGDGTWKVERGDTLYAVARKLAPGNSAKQAELRQYIVKNSPNAFVNGNPGRMEVGKTLNLPAGSGKVDTDNVGDIELSTAPMPVAKPSSGGGAAAAAPDVTPDMSFKERVEAKRKAREEAEKKAQLERRQQEMAAEQQRQAEAARRAEAEAARRAAADQERQRQQRLAAERARQQAAQQRQAAAQQQAKPAPAPQPQANDDVDNPYVLCPSLNYNGRCGYWR